MYLSLAKSYVYKLVHKKTGQFYYGSRKENVKFNRQAKDDLGICYFSSSKTIKEMGFENFHYEIIGEYDDFNEAYKTEHQLIKESFYHPLNLNKHLVDVENGKKHFCHAKEQSQEAIVKIRERRSTQIISDETRKRMSESHARRREMLRPRKSVRVKRVFRKYRFGNFMNENTHNKANPFIYDWFHCDGRNENLSVFKMMEKYSEMKKNYTSLLNGRLRTLCGWAMTKENAIKVNYSGVNNPAFDPTIYHWKNIDGREEWLTQYDIRAKYNYKSSNISALVKKREKSFKGWSIVWDS